jgi:hypothetical protein
LGAYSPIRFVDFQDDNRTTALLKLIDVEEFKAKVMGQEIIFNGNILKFEELTGKMGRFSFAVL